MAIRSKLVESRWITEFDVPLAKRRCCGSVAFVEQSNEQVLGSDGRCAVGTRLLLRQGDGAASVLSEALECVGRRRASRGCR